MTCLKALSNRFGLFWCETILGEKVFLLMIES